jgi:lauroyl/myristoyl acyltransferase
MTRPDSPISGTESASDDVKAEIEQLAYLGLRMGFGKSYPRRLIWQFAHLCLENKLSFAKAWMARRPFPPLRYCGLGNLRRAASRRRGVVIAACHVGQYHRIPLVLNKLGYAVTLLLDGENQAREEQELDGWLSRYNGPLERPIEYLNAELPTAPWRMSQALQKGRVLFVYMDGGTGLKNANPIRSSVEVRFCRLLLRVRKGLAYVAGRAGAPIVPTICHHSAEVKQSVMFCRDCFQSDGETLDAYCGRALQYCYSILEEQVLQNPACWEEWYHVHRWVVYPGIADMQNPPPQAGFEGSVKIEFQFDRENTEILKLPAGPVLFHTATGTAIEANEAISAVLRAARYPAAAADLSTVISGVSGEIESTLMLHQLAAAGFLRRVR